MMASDPITDADRAAGKFTHAEASLLGLSLELGRLKMEHDAALHDATGFEGITKAADAIDAILERLPAFRKAVEAMLNRNVDAATFAAAAVAEERARVFEQAARIAGNHPSFGPRDDFSRGVGRGRENAAMAIRKFAHADHLKGTPDGNG